MTSIADEPVFVDGQNRQELDILGGSVQLQWNFGETGAVLDHRL